MTSKSSVIVDVNFPAIHPGEILAEELAEIGVSIATLSRALDLPRSRLADVVARRRSVTADTALRLATYFGTSARLWLNLQTAYDLAVVQAKAGSHIASVVRPRVMDSTR